MDILKPDMEVLVITEKGYGKRTHAKEYPIKGRGGKGIKTVNITAKNGNLVGLTTVSGEEDIMLVTNKGVIIRFELSSVSQTGRSTQGVRLIRLEEDALVSTMATIEVEEEDNEEIIVTEEIDIEVTEDVEPEENNSEE